MAKKKQSFGFMSNSEFESFANGTQKRSALQRPEDVFSEDEMAAIRENQRGQTDFASAIQSAAPSPQPGIADSIMSEIEVNRPGLQSALQTANAPRIPRPMPTETRNANDLVQAHSALPIASRDATISGMYEDAVKPSNSTARDIWEGLKSAPLASVNAVDRPFYGGVEWVGDFLVQPAYEAGHILANITDKDLTLPENPVSKFAKSALKNIKASDAANSSDLNPHGWGQAVQGGIASTAQNLSTMIMGGIAGKVTGMTGEALTRFVQASSLGGLGAMSKLDKYAEKREAGFSKEAANTLGDIAGGIEVTTEFGPQMALVKMLSPGAKKSIGQLAANILKYDFGEYAGETVSTVLGDIMDKATAKPATTKEEAIANINNYFTKINPETGETEAWTNFKDTLKATFVQTSIMGAGGALLNRKRPDAPVDVNSPDVDLAQPGNPAPQAPVGNPYQQFGQNPYGQAPAQPEEMLPAAIQQAVPQQVVEEPQQVAAPQVEAPAPAAQEQIVVLQERAAAINENIIALNDQLMDPEIAPEQRKQMESQLKVLKAAEKAAGDNIKRLQPQAEQEAAQAEIERPISRQEFMANPDVNTPNPNTEVAQANVQNTETAIPEVAPMGQDVPVSRELRVVPQEQAISPLEGAGIGGEQGDKPVNPEAEANTPAVSPSVAGTANDMKIQREIMQHGFPDEDLSHYDTLIDFHSKPIKYDPAGLPKEVNDAWDKQNVDVREKMEKVDASELARKAGFSNTKMNGFQYWVVKSNLDSLDAAETREALLEPGAASSLSGVINSINFAYNEKLSNNGSNPVLATRLMKWKENRAVEQAVPAEDKHKSFAVDALPLYAQKAIIETSMERRTNEGGSIESTDPYAGSEWELQTVPLDEIADLPPTFQHRGSMTKGPIVIDSRGEVLDGNNRLYEAKKRGDKTIEVYKQVGEDKPPTPKQKVNKEVTPAPEAAAAQAPLEGKVEGNRVEGFKDAISAAMSEGRTLNKHDSLRMVAGIEGISVSELNTRIKNQEFDWKGVEEDVERAVVSLLSDAISFEEAIQIYNAQPVLGHRTGESRAMQQYSTPAPLAYIMQEWAGAEDGYNELKAVYGATAGNGMLLARFNPKIVSANELDERRASALKEMGLGKVTQKDATTETNTVRDKSQDVVIENPPFGSASMVVDGTNLSKMEHVIIAQALDKMKNDGKGVFIVGGHNFNGKGEMAASDWNFFNWLYNHYNVTHNIDVSGDLYRRQGTTFPIRVLTVEGRKATPTEIYIPKKLSDARAKALGFTNEVATTFEQVSKAVNTPREAYNEADAGQGDARGRDTGLLPGAGENQPSDVNAADADSAGPGERLGSDGDRAGHPGPVGEGQGRREPVGVPAGAQHQDGAADRPESGRVAGDAQGRPGGRRLKPEYEGADPDVLKGVIEVFGEDFVYEDAQQNPAPAPAPQEKSEADQVADIWADFSLTSDDQNKAESLWQKTVPVAKAALDKAIASFDLLKTDASAIVSEFVKNFATQIKQSMEKAGVAAQDIARRFGAIFPRLNQFAQDSRAWIEQKIQDARAPKEDVESHELQVLYTPRSKGTNSGKMIPKSMADAMQKALENLENEVGDLDEYVTGLLQYGSKDAMFKAFYAEQVDGVALALSAIRKGQGMIIGDQTGAGKGRIAAGVMLYANLNGMRPIFLTEKPKLFSDINRDMVAILESHPDVKVMKPYLMASSAEGDVVDEESNIIYSFFNGIRKAALGKRKEGAMVDPNAHQKIVASDPATHLNGFDYVALSYSQLQGNKPAAALRRDIISNISANTIVVMDEAHNAAGESGVGEFIANNVLNQAAGVTYLSATYAKRPEAMAIYYRTELGATGMSMDSMIKAIQDGGVPLQQHIAAMLARAGQYRRSEMDFSQMEKPSIFVNQDEQHTKELIEKMDSSTAILRAINTFSRKFNDWVQGPDVAGVINGNIRNKKDRLKVDSSGFGSVVHNYVRQLLLALKAGDVADQAIAAFHRGEKPLLYVDNTMESFLSDFAAEHGLETGDWIPASYGEVLRMALKRQLRYTVTPPGGGKANRVEQIVEYDQLPQHLQALHDEITGLVDNYNVDVSLSPLDATIQAIHDRFEADKELQKKLGKTRLNIGEITGRTKVIDLSDPEAPKLDNKKKVSRNDLVNGFNNGKYDVLLFNQAGATGLSLHATKDTADKRPRHMLIIQPSLNIDSYLQALGRIFRTGQIEKPFYTQMVLNLPAETRPTVIQNRKLASINANLSAKSDGVFKNANVPDMDNAYGDQVVVEFLAGRDDLMTALTLDYNGEGRPNVSFQKLTGRMALLPAAEQTAIWGELVPNYEARINYLTEIGENKLIAKDYDLQARTISRQVLFDGAGEGEFQQPAYLDKVTARILKKPFTRSKIGEMVEEELDGQTPEVYAQKIVNEASGAVASYIADQATKLVMVTPDMTEEELAEALKENATPSRLMANAEANLESYKRLAQDLKIGHTYDLTMDDAGTIQTGVLTKIRYKHSGAGSPVAPSKLSFIFAVASAQQSLPIPASQAMVLASARLVSKGVPENWDQRIPNANTETRYIVSGNILTGYSRVPNGKGEMVQYTNDKGEMMPGILLPHSAHKDIDTMFASMVVSAQKAAQLIRQAMSKGIDLTNMVVTLQHNSRLRMWMFNNQSRRDAFKISMPNTNDSKAFYTDRELTQLTAAKRFDQGTGNNASLMEAWANKSDLEAVINRINEISGGQATFEVPRYLGEQGQGDAPAFSLKDKNVRAGVEMSRLQAMSSRIRAMFPGIKVVVHESPAGLDWAHPDARGAYYNGEVHLFRSNLKNTSSAVATVLAHEFTHHGISRMGERGKQLLKQIAVRHNKEVLEIMKSRQWDDTADNRVRAANELLAQYGETHLDPNLWTRVKEFLKSVAAKMLGREVEDRLLRDVLDEVKGAPQKKGSDGDAQQEISPDDDPLFSLMATGRMIWGGLKDAAGKYDRFFKTLGTNRLPTPYKFHRYLAYGKMGESTELASRLYQALKKSRKLGIGQEVFDYLTTKDADPALIPDAGVRAAAEEAKQVLFDLGDAAVSRKLMSDETFEKRSGAYLTRLYLAHLIKDTGGFTTIGAGGKTLDLGQFAQRTLDDKEDIRTLLGEIKDPAYLTYVSVFRASRDLAVHDFLQNVMKTFTDLGYTAGREVKDLAVLPKQFISWSNDPDAPFAIGRHIEYTVNADDTFNVSVTKVNTTYDSFNAVAAADVEAIAGDSMTAKGITHGLGMIVPVNGVDAGWRKVGIVQYMKRPDGTFELKVERVNTTVTDYPSTHESDLDNLVGARNAETMRTGSAGYKGGRWVTPFWLANEAAFLELQARDFNQPGPDSDAQKQLLEDTSKRMRTLASNKLQELGISTDAAQNLAGALAEQGWRKLPDTKKYGALRGAVVRKELYDDIVGNMSVVLGDRDIVLKMLGDRGVLWHMHKAWKMMKTTAELPVWAANFASNVVQMHLAGHYRKRHAWMGPLAPVLLLAEAGKQIHRKSGAGYEAATRMGLKMATFANVDLPRMERELLETVAASEDRWSARHVASLGKLLATTIYNIAGSGYQSMETLGKVAVMISELESGKSEFAAAEEANRVLFDYSDVPAWARSLREIPLGAPFFTFAYKSIPRTIEAMARPGNWHRTAQYPAIYAGLVTWSMMGLGLLGGDDDDWRKKLAPSRWWAAHQKYRALVNTLPEYERNKAGLWIAPWKDSDGRNTLVDFTRYLPFGAIVTAGMKMSDASSMLDVLSAGNEIVPVGTGPVPTLYTAMTTNRDGVGREIYDEAGTSFERIASAVAYTAKTMLPNMIAGESGVRANIQAAMTDEKDKYGFPRKGAGEAALSVVGTRVKRFDPDIEREKQLKRMQYQIRDQKNKIKWDAANAGGNAKEIEKIVERRTGAIKRIMDKQQRLIEETDYK